MLLSCGTTGGGTHGLACVIGIPMFPTRKNYTEIQSGHIMLFRGLALVRSSAFGDGEN
jgi:hypothetical protein